MGGPKGVDKAEETTIYISDDVLDVEPLDQMDGLAYIEQKLLCPEEWERPNDLGTSHILGRLK